MRCPLCWALGQPSCPAVFYGWVSSICLVCFVAGLVYLVASHGD
jgi:hypothetical protein